MLIRNVVFWLTILLTCVVAAEASRLYGWDYRAAIAPAAVLVVSAYIGGGLAFRYSSDRANAISVNHVLSVVHIGVGAALVAQLATGARPMVEVPAATAVAQLIAVWILHRRECKRTRSQRQ